MKIGDIFTVSREMINILVPNFAFIDDIFLYFDDNGTKRYPKKFMIIRSLKEIIISENEVKKYFKKIV